MASEFHSTSLQRYWRAPGRRLLASCFSSGIYAERAWCDSPVILKKKSADIPDVPPWHASACRLFRCCCPCCACAPTSPKTATRCACLYVRVCMGTCTCICVCMRVCVCVYWACTTLFTAHRILSNSFLRPTSQLYTARQRQITLQEARQRISQSAGLIAKVKILYLFFEERAAKGDWDDTVASVCV